MEVYVAGKRAVGVAFLFLSVGVSLFAPQTSHSAKARGLVAADAETAARVNAGFGQLPIRFEANQGQFDPAVDFTANGGGYSLALKSDEASFQLRQLRAAESLISMNERAGVSKAKIAQLKLIPYCFIPPSPSSSI